MRPSAANRCGFSWCPMRSPSTTVSEWYSMCPLLDLRWSSEPAGNERPVDRIGAADGLADRDVIIQERDELFPR